MKNIFEKIIFESQNFTIRDFNGKFYTLGIYSNGKIEPIKYDNKFYIVSRTFFGLKELTNTLNKNSYFYIEFEANFHNCILFNQQLKEKIKKNNINDIKEDDLSPIGVNKIYDDKNIYFFKNVFIIENPNYTFVENGVIKKQFGKNEFIKNIKEIYG